MERDPGEFERRDDEASRNDGEDDLDRLLASLPPAPGIKYIDDDDDDDDEDEDFTDIEAAIAEGRAFPHEVVGAWLKTWGQPDQKPFKEWLANQDG